MKNYFLPPLGAIALILCLMVVGGCEKVSQAPKKSSLEDCTRLQEKLLSVGIFNELLASVKNVPGWNEAEWKAAAVTECVENNDIAEDPSYFDCVMKASTLAAVKGCSLE